ncbi:hypothetical protein COT70_01850 [candidate division WWE3 bacterium CG09_land_8_20_14_0_10_47_33]|uniref:3D domain-containing protein n=1 Tax=candidate division WWE3 bacterium CG_4_9_14_0_2_um_filter_48_10 TaxID=1975078 RepID=A0A2M8EJC7_UNCKA|nr:MAG: hypothetical protein COT70_01850 [candidate division WWE3 bacterium CG09_land_8_20_14_0_10_47_33]PIZ41530.1 MAG: hypothetical protein COY35_00210 [candidate division WWE3 bacterium CG_4_10_14_0_2_um_filter_47_8]PJC22846.1 MAG: hypothetical protein CO059_01555 [candidate division WWE3 bacterium CG_4_9_14_0_2_um_filter_48_10]PJE51875.1 MAG: hypothetical protein COV28_01540 [candidate division WWE3 bacterium CG10_big_fil_rev_8_21_14_0_10_48_23]
MKEFISVIFVSLLFLRFATTPVPTTLDSSTPPPQETSSLPSKPKTIDGLPYTRRLRVYTTSYDGNCPGCRGRTYSGTEVKKGVCAVDPKVIPLGTWFYIPNYGKCHAEDIGEAVKGLRVDVGWTDASKGWLPQGWKDIYILK